MFRRYLHPPCPHRRKDLSFIRNLHGDEINNYYPCRSMWYCNKCNTTIFTPELFDIGEYSDGYHTFNELYHHRAILFAVICNQFKDKCWKSLKHNDGSMYSNMFIVGIDTPEGPATYHYYTDKYWDLFDVKELPFAPEWDAHTPEDAINRIKSLIQ